MLHITNGKSTELNRTHLAGDIVFWSDVLHEGPVPASGSLEAVSAARVPFLAQLSGQPEDAVRAEFAGRDQALREHTWHSQVVFWFEHDLYDQLQLLQALDFFSREKLEGKQLWLINPEEYLGEMTPEDLERLFASKVPVTAEQLDLAARAWQAFTAGTPAQLAAFTGAGALPHLGAAIARLCEHYPSTRGGVNRTERLMLDLAANGQFADRAALFSAYQSMDLPKFMGDTVFFRYLDGLTAAGLLDADLGITGAGREVLAGAADLVALHGIDRWIGGVHLSGRGPVWRWNGSVFVQA